MLKLNKYLKEIGINENFWLFNAKENNGDKRFFPNEDGFVEAETWDLGQTMDLFIYSHLRYFKDIAVSSCTPICYCFDKNGKRNKKGHEKWLADLDYVIETFRLRIIEEEKAYKELGLKYIKDYQKFNERISKGMKLFINIYNLLWW